MLDKIKKLVAGFVTTDPVRAAVATALLPTQAVSEDFHRRCVDFVVDGSGPALLMELHQSPNPLTDELMGFPGQIKFWTYIGNAWPHLVKLGIVGKSGFSQSADRVLALRDPLYRLDLPEDEQWLRLARLLVALSADINRTAPDVPDWFTALINDLISTIPRKEARPSQGSALTARAWWGAYRLAALLEADGIDASIIPTVMLLGLFQGTSERNDDHEFPDRLPAVMEYFAEHGRQVPASAVSRLSAAGRTRLAERATDVPALAAAVPHLVAALAVDSSKGARLAALKALDVLDADVRSAALAPVLAKAPAAKSNEIVEYLANASGGPALLADAAVSNPRIAALVAQAIDRGDALASAEVEETPLELPPFDTIPDASAAGAKAELRRTLDKVIARANEGTESYHKSNAERAAPITDAMLDELVEVAEGRSRTSPKLLNTYNIWWVAESAPSLNLLHLLRLQLAPDAGRRSRSWVLGRGMRVESDTDPRTLEDALSRVGVGPRSVSGHVWYSADPEVAWPWLALHLDEALDKLRSPDTATRALQILEHFPRLPEAVVRPVSAIAVSDSKTNRPLAQRVLSGHPAARTLAEQALGDSRGEIRAAAASWLAALADPAAVPALRAALAKERREVVRAGLLTALEASGEDISAELAPEVLLAEAVKGLKAKRPASMAWFDDQVLPAATWADGTPVDPRILTWWVVLADKLKDPSGIGLIDRYLSRLSPASAETLGSVVLRSWITQDTRHPTDEESRAHAAVVGPQRYRSAQDWLARVKAHPQWRSSIDYVVEAAAVSVEKHTADAYAEHQATYLGSATADKGLLALTTRMSGIELANAVTAYLRNNSGRRSQAETLMYALHGNGQPAALQVLLGVARRHRMAGVQATARTLVEDVAAARGWTPDELADRTIPTAGFGDDQVLHLQYPSREFTGRLTAAGTIELSNPDGKVIKTLPDARADEDAEAVKEVKKQLTGARKEAKAVLTLQTSRLYEAMCISRTWSASDWSEFLAGHPLMAQLVTRLVWLENPGTPQQRAFRPTEDGALIDAADEPIELDADARIGLAHATALDAESVGAWRGHLADYAVKLLFEQLVSYVPDFNPADTEFDELRGHMSDTFSFRGVAGKRGYTRAAAEDGGWFTEYLKPFASAGLTAVIGFSGSYLPEENIACATGTLSFSRGRRPVPLGEVPPVMLAECFADYAALAALGPFDPDHERKAGL